MYIGVSPSKFDDLVKRKIMPQPRRIDSCVIWDLRSLDLAFDDLPGGGSSLDDGDPQYDFEV
ncbi:hypothetical protein [Labrys sp. KNU-23]|uniref:hypothetical protein n=1 Tax=Labrys sp. KNU-23 TaxID=2789216 RepID=UPI00352A70E8